jgi:FAD/FMN-containing dehydrogenase
MFQLQGLLQPDHTAALRGTQSVVSSSVESLSIVNSDGELKEYSRSKTDPTTWKALTANLGMAGAVVQMRLRVQPQFNLDMKVTYHSESDLFKKGGVGKLVERCDFALINWFPGTDRFMRSCGMKTTKKENTGANNVLLDPGLPKFAVNPFKKVLQYGACNNAVACMIEKVRYLYFKLRPPFATIAKNGKRSYKKHLIGPSHRMMSSHLTSYQKGLAQMDWEVVVPLNQIEPAMKAVRSIVDQHNLCLPLVGVFIRFGIAEDTSLLAHSVALGSFKAGDMVAFIEIPSYIPTGFTDHRRALYDLPYEEFTRKLIEEFNGRPHWGKNREWAFVRAQELDVYGVNRAAFQSTMRAMDPQGMFVNDWAKLVLFD